MLIVLQDPQKPKGLYLIKIELYFSLSEMEVVKEYEQSREQVLIGNAAPALPGYINSGKAFLRVK